MDTKNVTMTQKERVMELREAYKAGALAFSTADHHVDNEAKCDACEVIDRMAAKHYPLPPLSLGVYAGREYRLRDGVLEYQTRAHAPLLGPPTDERPRWDRASLQPNDIRELAAELVDAD